jgi:hypothetical protein
MVWMNSTAAQEVQLSGGRLNTSVGSVAAARVAG